MLTTEALIADIQEQGVKAHAAGDGMGGTYQTLFESRLRTNAKKSKPAATSRTTKEVAMFGRKEPSGEEIARRAHELYVERGCEHGKHVEDWVRAEKELRDEPVAEPAKTSATRVVRNTSN